MDVKLNDNIWNSTHAEKQFTQYKALKMYIYMGGYLTKKLDYFQSFNLWFKWVI